MTSKSLIPTTSLGSGFTRNSKGSERQKLDNEPAMVRKAKILVVDHDSALRSAMVACLRSPSYAVDTADTAQAALDACVRSRPNLVIAELSMNHMDGLAFLKELKSRWPQLIVIALTSHGTISEAVQATQGGAFGYLVKPVGKEELLGQVKRATAASTFTLTDGDWRASFLSRGQLMEDRLALANRAAGCEEPVLLTGENGTGKELLARAIHAASVRREGPFIAVACGNTAERELRSKLFGDGAEESARTKPAWEGAFERAAGGTLLLDEIGDMPMELQVALAKALKLGPCARSTGAACAGVRLMCTTSGDLKSLAANGAFLHELYYQINILPIEIPPLGRRREDIPLLVSHFLEQATLPGGQQKIYSSRAIELLATTNWPGNVRQLFDLVKQNVAMSHGKVMTKEFVQKFLKGGRVKIPTYDEARDKFSRDYLAANMQRTAGNVTQAARLAKRNRTDFYNLLARYRLHPEDFKNADRAGDKRKNAGESKDRDDGKDEDEGKDPDDGKDTGNDAD